MSNLPKPQPLSPTELERLAEFLESCPSGNAMNLEELDGFFAALIAGPETVMPSEYLPAVFSADKAEDCGFESIDEANEILQLLMRHWNTIVAGLFNREPYTPFLVPDDQGAVHGNDWAYGFVRGMEMRQDGWEELGWDEKTAKWLIPVMMLYYEHSEDPELRPRPITPAVRAEVIAAMAAGLLQVYEFFRQRREEEVARAAATRSGRSGTKAGRNAVCPCGSGKKYKKCCGGAVVH